MLGDGVFGIYAHMYIKAGYAHLFGSKEGLYAPLSFGVGMSYRINARNKK